MLFQHDLTVTCEQIWWPRKFDDSDFIFPDIWEDSNEHHMVVGKVTCDLEQTWPRLKCLASLCAWIKKKKPL